MSAPAPKTTHYSESRLHRPGGTLAPLGHRAAVPAGTPEEGLGQTAPLQPFKVKYDNTRPLTVFVAGRSGNDLDAGAGDSHTTHHRSREALISTIDIIVSF